MDILAMLVRDDRIKLLVEKKRPIWLQEEKDKEAGVGQPITFGDEEDDSWMDEMIDSESEEDEEEDEEEEEEGEKKDDEEEGLATFPDDWVWKRLTPEELTEQRISDYTNMLRRMNTHQFTQLCVREGVIDENQVFDTIGVPHN